MNDRSNFLTARQSGIGGSDIGAILGVSPFKSAVDVYLDKINPTPQESLNELFYWGHALEKPIAERFMHDHGVDIVRPKAIFRHPKHDWMVANLDGIIPGEPGGVLEIKTVGTFGGKDWGETETDQVPLSYLAQCAWYMAVMDYPYAKIAALFGGNDYREFHINRDLELEAQIISQGQAFWFNHVQKREAPTAQSARDVAQLFRRDDGSTLEADDELFALFEQLKHAKSAAKQADQGIELAETQIKARMGTATTLRFNGQALATWKTQTAQRFDSKTFESDYPDLYAQFKKTSESRVFRIK